MPSCQKECHLEAAYLGTFFLPLPQTHSPVLCNTNAGQNGSWTEHFTVPRDRHPRAGFSCYCLSLIPHVFTGRQHSSSALKKCGVTHWESHRSLCYRKASRLFRCKPLYKVFISLGCSEILGAVGNTILQNKETAMEK